MSVEGSGSGNASGRPSGRATTVPDPKTGTRLVNDPSVSASRKKTPRSSSRSSASSSPSGRASRKAHSASSLSALLEPFNRSKNGGRIPSSSRVGADISVQKTANQIGLLESWKYLPFLAHQATALTSAFVSHHVFGPPKKSWGIELTLFTTAVRESAQFSHLSSLGMLRGFLNLGRILPTPADGVVTPVTFKVRQRGLTGLLREADEREDGTREITGEWVVSKRMWRRMQQDHFGTSSRSRSSTRQPRPDHQQPSSHHFSKDKVVLYLHGGAYYVMSAATHRYITISVSKYTDCRVFAVNYRLAPECRWPGQIHDAVSAYLRLTRDLKIPPQNIIIAGDSAGGGLTLALLMYLRDNGFDLPCGTILMSPWVDLTMSCDSWETNAHFDYLRMPSGDDHMNPIAAYLGAANVKTLVTHPYVSPLFGDFRGLPPLLIQCGDAECLRDEGTLLAHKASLAGVQVFHEVYEDCPHVFQALFFLEASKKAFRSHRHFVKRILPTLARSTTMDVDELDEEVMRDAHAIKKDGTADEAALDASPEQYSASLENDDEEEDDDGDDENGRVSPDADANNDGHEGLGNEGYGTLANTATRAVGDMIHAATSVSPQTHHNLDTLNEEQNEHVDALREEEAQSNQTVGRPTIDTSSHIPGASAPLMIHSPPSQKSRHRSISSLTLTPSTSPKQSTAPSLRPTHSRQTSRDSFLSSVLSPFKPATSPLPSSAQTSPTINRPGLVDGDLQRPGYFKRDSRPRARSGSHPDLQALIDSYDAHPSQHTIVWHGGSGESEGEGPN